MNKQVWSQKETSNELHSQGWEDKDINKVLSKASIAQNTTQKGNLESMFDFANMKWYVIVVLIPAFFLLIQGGVLDTLIGTIG